MIVLDLSILNQKGTPMFNSDTFANRPNFGIVGRIFISTDTKEFYRDTGTSWELIGGPGSGTITGSGAATQVAFWNGTSTISGSNNLWWDATNSYLGINTNTPTTSLDVHHTNNNGAIFNQTTVTNNNLIAFQTSGLGRWRIGNFYTAGADDFGIFDVVGALQQFTIVKTTGQTFIGAKTLSSGRLVVNSATADAHLQIVGANSPSIRIDNAGSGGTQRFVFGLATATNNFIQGATAGEFCISTQSAGAMLFGMWQSVNASEVMRITTANNLLIGSSVDGGQRLQVAGKVNSTGYFLNGMTSGSGALYFDSGANRVTLANYNVGGILNFEVNGGSSAATIDAAGNFGLGLTPSAWGFSGNIELLDGRVLLGGGQFFHITQNAFNNGANWIYKTTNRSARYSQEIGSHVWYNAPLGTAGNPITFTQAMTLDSDGNLLVGGTTRLYGAPNRGLIEIKGNSEALLGFGTFGSVGLGFLYHSGTNMFLTNSQNGALVFTTNSIEAARISPALNLLVGTNVDIGKRLQIAGTAYISGITEIGVNASNSHQLNVSVNGGADREIFITTVVGISNGFRVRYDNASGKVRVSMSDLPTSPVGLIPGDLWNNLGILNII